MNSERNRTRKDLRVEGRIDGEYSELIMKEENIGVFRLDSPTHPAFWAKITTPFATQTTENIIYQLLKRNDQNILSPETIMRVYARLYLDKWETDPASLIKHIEEWSDGWDTTEALHWHSPADLRFVRCAKSALDNHRTHAGIVGRSRSPGCCFCIQHNQSALGSSAKRSQPRDHHAL